MVLDRGRVHGLGPSLAFFLDLWRINGLGPSLAFLLTLWRINGSGPSVLILWQRVMEAFGPALLVKRLDLAVELVVDVDLGDG